MVLRRGTCCKQNRSVTAHLTEKSTMCDFRLSQELCALKMSEFHPSPLLFALPGFSLSQLAGKTDLDLGSSRLGGHGTRLCVFPMVLAKIPPMTPHWHSFG